MVRRRNVVMVFALATGLAGCSFEHVPSIAHFSPFHCDTCDDFPTPAYGPNYSMMPGTYTGPAIPGTATQPGVAPPASGATAGAMPAAGTTPPAVPPMPREAGPAPATPEQ